MSSEQETKQKPKPLWPSVMSMGGLVLLAYFLFVIILESTTGFRRFGVSWALFITMATAICLVPLLGVLLAVLALLRKWWRLPRWVCGKLFVGLGFAVVVGLLVLGLLESRPKTRLMKVTSGAAAKASNVEVSGFGSFLARRWLYSFDATEADFVAMAESLDLEPLEGIDLQVTLGRDIFFQNAQSDLWQDAPGEGVSLSYYRETKRDEFVVTWMTFVYSDSAKRAWLFTGYQN